ncbi:hypothetical protein FNF27_06506 [Cafeteria roenbergensis]|uniref:30S ribosomal protein S17, chloroplastic n=1 Tax=Cafeteria roenbergensis TaxID=33653 RepID=A0A5A8DY79_CAFRO|nr:hypothetical protein FNF31_03254 [Cafeteria roenbergensis]KAA0170475.1 hypothetical protein FNF28_01469 [Cafeteria roenbergensis]KAA0170809.1 hypothetical protein FNF27_06506 [Cafeteria roenbergensis]
MLDGPPAEPAPTKKSSCGRAGAPPHRGSRPSGPQALEESAKTPNPLPGPPVPRPARVMRRLKKVVGTVVSSSMDKTAVVEVQRLYVHSKYRRIMRKRLRYFAHDEHDICGVGDRVQIWPMGERIGKRSARKTWAVVDILHRQPRLEGEPCELASLMRPGEVVDASHPVIAAANSVIEARKTAEEAAAAAADTAAEPDADARA